ncbi:hypothetical protein [Haloferula sp.]|uniref:hypothetical protein n=1 Tax=Haloferula sp. TaxID=2497595 RepID=UPI00329F5309
MRTKFLISLPAIATLLLASCATDPHVNAAQTRGAVGGAALGAIIGNNAGGIGQGEAMLAGAALGALAGENQARRTNPNLVGRPSLR